MTDWQHAPTRVDEHPTAPLPLVTGVGRHRRAFDPGVWHPRTLHLATGRLKVIAAALGLVLASGAFWVVVPAASRAPLRDTAPLVTVPPAPPMTAPSPEPSSPPPSAGASPTTTAPDAPRPASPAPPVRRPPRRTVDTKLPARKPPAPAKPSAPPPPPVAPPAPPTPVVVVQPPPPAAPVVPAVPPPVAPSWPTAPTEVNGNNWGHRWSSDDDHSYDDGWGRARGQRDDHGDHWDGQRGDDVPSQGDGGPLISIGGLP